MDFSGRHDGLMQRLATGPVICAEGYLFELERRGYVQAGPFVPEVVLDHPEQVTVLHEQFVHAGSDVVQAFTYYAHREKLRLIGKHDLIEPINRQALDIAKAVARRTDTLLAGDICNTNVYNPDDRGSHDQVRAMFDEQVGWAVDADVDFAVGETFSFLGEALLALESIKRAGLPAVITLVPHSEPDMRDGYLLADACGRLAAAGADVVGLNCSRGMTTMLPLLEQIVPVLDVPVAALPVPYRTTEQRPTFQSLREDGEPEGRPFPTGLDPFVCNRYEVADFTRQAWAMGVRYFGLCCGAAPHHVRSMAETLGRIPPASRYSEDMSKHAYFGTDPTLASVNREYSGRL